MNKPFNLSVVISAYNEENKIEGCLKSVQFADEILFVNSSSTDNTVSIAKKYTQNIFTRPNNLMLNINKNYGISKAKGEWILILDADERVTPELKQEIELRIMNYEAEINGYWIPRKNILFGKWIQNAIWWPDYQLRLFIRGKGEFPEKHVHEYLEVEGETEKLHNPLVHENYSTVSQFLYKMDKIYTESEVQKILNEGRKITWADAIRFPVDDFLKTFFSQKGYKDGLHGLVLSLLQAFYAEVVFAKVWEKQGFTEMNSKNFLHEVYEQARKVGKEFMYWFLSSSIEEERNSIKKLSLRLLRRKIKAKL